MATGWSYLTSAAAVVSQKAQDAGLEGVGTRIASTASSAAETAKATGNSVYQSHQEGTLGANASQKAAEASTMIGTMGSSLYSKFSAWGGAK